MWLYIKCGEDKNDVLIRAEIEQLYEKYLKVLGVFDTETVEELTEEECAALIKVMEIRNKLMDMKM